MLLKKHVIGGSLLQSVTEINRDDDIYNVYLFKVHTVLVESYIKVTFKSRRQLTLDVPNLTNFDLSDEISDSLFALLREEFFQLVGAQFV